MTDKELADKVIGLGIGERPKNSSLADFVYFRGMELEDRFVRDRRVAGALMEKCQAVFVEKLSDDMWACRADKCYGSRTREWYHDENQSRAITEACVEALS